MKIKIVAITTVILLLMVMSVPVYAETTIPPLPSGGWEYWVVVMESSVITYVTSHNPIKVETDRKCTVLNTYKIYHYLNDQWKLTHEELGEGGFWFRSMIASNHDIAYEDGSGFFFLSPKVPRLYPTMKMMDFGTILRNFSAGLIPIIGCLILVISLRKGWEFLRTQLTH